MNTDTPKNPGSTSVADKVLEGSPHDTQNTATRHAKIKPEHYNYMLSEIRKVATPDMIAIHRRYLTNENKAKDVEKRLRWDFAYSAKLTPFICDNLYSYANDTHIDTALRSIIKTCEASTTASAQPRVSMLLSTGRTVAHERMSNGAQHAYIIGSATGEMTENEWIEYVSLIANP